MTDPLPPHKALFPDRTAPPPKPPSRRRGLVLAGLVAAFAAGWWLRAPTEPVPDAVAVRSLARIQEVLPDAAPTVVDLSQRVVEDLAAIRAAQLARTNAGRAPLALPMCPEAQPGRAMLPFGGDCRAAWEALGWALPDAVPCRYRVVDPGDGDFRAIAECDPDADGSYELWLASAADAPRRWSLGG
jgi:hypothetical protein